MRGDQALTKKLASVRDAPQKPSVSAILTADTEDP